MEATLLYVLVALAALTVILLSALLVRPRGDAALRGKFDALRGDSERVERVLRDEQRAGRTELAQSFEQFRGHVQAQLETVSTQQRQRIEEFSTRLSQLIERTDRGGEALRNQLLDDARKTRAESQAALQQFSEQLQAALKALTVENQQRLAEVRATLDAQLKALQTDNAAQLDKMREVVDEKLQKTLEARLGQSFGVIVKQLEAVQRGLGEMQTLAVGVGDLKRVLSNVKTRGTFGEVQLGALLEQILTADQYTANVAVVPHSAERVEYAIRLPGQDGDAPVWLPIDCKFPTEDYQRLLDAQERADAETASAAAQALERRVRDEARTIHDKYISPPHTTDFAILFLPAEGLYAEVIRRPGLFEVLQREYRVTVAGPTTLTAILNALQMGFRTLAIERRSSEVWRLLGEVKTEFGKFGGILEKAERQLNTVSKSIGEAGRKTRTITRALRDVESLPAAEVQSLLEDAALQDFDDDASPKPAKVDPDQS
ncbi:MAG TPA: DNA recombination protein RmuC [Rhodanobacteraceae bacterium]|nr:DNA recombination protein RmuC [Rhodanobacteraceae bacterium]